MIVLVLLVVHLVGGWYFANVLRDDALDPATRRESAAFDYEVEVIRVDDATVTLRDEGDDDLATEGVFGLAWEGGYGRLGHIVARSEGAVTRELALVEGSPPTPGQRTDVDEKAVPHDPARGLGLAYDDVVVDGPLGALPAWFVPGSDGLWAVLVHGNSLDRADTLRLLGVTAQAGLPSLVVSVRNDPGAPADPSGCVRYGDTEWADLEAAVRYALDRGAERVVLVGQSMGGGVVLTFLERSALRGAVAGAVLESPMVDFAGAVRHGASKQELPLGAPLPGTITATAMWLADVRFGVDWDALDHRPEAQDLTIPVLVIHGTADDTVPFSQATELEDAQPVLVTLLPITGADHLRSWNVASETVESAIGGFLAGLER